MFPEEQDYEDIVGRKLNARELEVAKAVQNSLMRKLGHMPSAHTHSEHCWSFGPSHYFCCYRKVEELLAEKRDADSNA